MWDGRFSELGFLSARSISYRPATQQQAPNGVNEMVGVGARLPRRIEPDAIVESVLEIRFDSAAPLPEILIARMAESQAWQGYAQIRMPAADIPASMREADKNLRYVPTFELRGEEGRRLIRIGPHVLSLHQMAPYDGWNTFHPLMQQATRELFAKSEHLVVRRLGLRYINGLSQQAHGIASIRDLDIRIVASEGDVDNHFSLTFSKVVADDAKSLVRVCTSDFGMLKAALDASVVVDTDTSTPEEYEARDLNAVLQWIDRARNWKNDAFLRLLSQDTLNRLGRDE